MEIAITALILSTLLIVVLVPWSVWKAIIWVTLLVAAVFTAYCSLHLILFEYNSI